MGWDISKPADTDKGKVFPLLNRTDKIILQSAWDTEHEALAGASWIHKANFLTLAMIPDGLITAAKLVAGVGVVSGTRMVFDQDAAPTGWTRDTSFNDRLVRIVSGARAHGGSWTISGLSQAVHGHTVNSHNHSMGNHIHSSGSYHITTTLLGKAAANPQDIDLVAHAVYGVVGDSGVSSGDTGGAAPLTDNAQPAVSADGTWRPLHRDMIVAVKD